ncbi:GNAT family N-acetyltransferase [Nocardioides sp. 503]|uniref:GNAT family N-acetyltransferase n=1 Tax=Nocardioides sp. 503 TaxID=2508326 RepID=UPI00106F5A4E|nr:GNAT family N-acetyltransferase [Nocardioides sp. 503]
MSELRTRLVDPDDDAAVVAWHDVYSRAERHGREELATPWQLAELRVQLKKPSRRRRWVGILGEADGGVVAAGAVMLPLLDNLDQAEVAVHVDPGRRRRGHGTAMLAAVEEVVRSEGRHLLAAEAAWPYDLGPTGAGSPGLEFALAHGFRLALGDVVRELRLPVAEELLAELAAEAAAYHRGYTLRSFVGPVPDELLQGWAELSSSLMTEAPTGEMDREPEAVDLVAQREAEDLHRRQGRTKYNTVALDADGAVVAYTDVATTVHEPGRVYQWGTLVRRADRGHRLGMAVKVANLRLLQREDPGAERVVTWNAEVNGHMVGVNERLGFVPVERAGELQKRLT